MKWSLGEVMRTTLAASAVAGCAATGALIFVSGRLAETGDGTTASLAGRDVATVGIFALGAGLAAVGVRILAQRRRAPRLRCRLTGVIAAPDGDAFIRAENISRTGARLFVGETRLVEGRIYRARLGTFETKVEVRWTQGRRAGVSFEDELSARAFDRLLASGQSLLSARARSASRAGRGAGEGETPPPDGLALTAPAMGPRPVERATTDDSGRAQSVAPADTVAPADSSETAGPEPERV